MNIWYECWNCHYKEMIYDEKYTVYTFRLPLVKEGACKLCGANEWCLIVVQITDSSDT